MRAQPRAVFATLLAASVAAFASCAPKYPSCENDEHCRAREYCVKGNCQQCRSSADCSAGSECKSGRCYEAPRAAGGCNYDDNCPAGQSCIMGQCRPCSADDQCGDGGKCRGGRCLRSGMCQTDNDCPQSQDCVNGKCVGETKVARTGPNIALDCTLDTIYFDFNEYSITADGSGALQKVADCVKRSQRPVTIIGHTDPRGTDEYNLALSERRAQSTRAYLIRLGIDESLLKSLPRGELDATGTDEGTWARDRRVDFQWQ